MPQTDTPSPTVAALRRASYLYPSGRGVEELEVELRAGDLVAFVGEPGSGRTTALRLLAGELEPSRGEAEFHLPGEAEEAGEVRSPRGARRRIAFQGERDAHFPGLSGFRNACYFGSLYGMSRAALLTRVDGLFDELDLRALRDVPLSSWDGDARRRLSILEALLPEPDLILLDEPLRGLHFGSGFSVKHALERAASRGAAVALSAAPGEAREIARRSILLERGRMTGEQA